MQTQKSFRVIRLLQASLRVMTQKNDAKYMTQSDHVDIFSSSDEGLWEIIGLEVEMNKKSFRRNF